jgi:hypothetical protein
MTDSPVKHDRVFLDRVLEDIQDLLEYAAERTNLSKIDDDLVADAADVLRPGADRGAPGFAAAALGVLDRLTAVVRPATPCGVRFARHATRDKGSRECRLLTRARYQALLTLMGVFIIYGYIAYGQTIVRAIDTLRPQIDQVQDQLRTLIAASDPPGRTGQPYYEDQAGARPATPPPAAAQPNAQNPPAATAPGEQAPPRAAAAAPAPQPAPAAQADDLCTRTGTEKAVGAAWMRECNRLVETAQNLSSQFHAAHDRLHDWRDALLSLPVFLNLMRRTDIVCFDEASQLALYPRLPAAERAQLGDIVASVDGNGLLLRRPQCLGGRDGSYAEGGELTAQAYGFRQRHEQQARSIIDTVALLILPGLFGLLGAMLAYVRELQQAMSEQRVDPAIFARSSLQLLLGTVLGALTGVLFSQSFMAENFGLERFAVAVLRRLQRRDRLPLPARSARPRPAQPERGASRRPARPPAPRPARARRFAGRPLARRRRAPPPDRRGAGLAADRRQSSAVGAAFVGAGPRPARAGRRPRVVPAEPSPAFGGPGRPRAGPYECGETALHFHPTRARPAARASGSRRRPRRLSDSTRPLPAIATDVHSRATAGERPCSSLPSTSAFGRASVCSRASGVPRGEAASAR